MVPFFDKKSIFSISDNPDFSFPNNTVSTMTSDSESLHWASYSADNTRLTYIHLSEKSYLENPNFKKKQIFSNIGLIQNGNSGFCNRLIIEKKQNEKLPNLHMLCFYKKGSERKLVYRRKDELTKTNTEIVITQEQLKDEEFFEFEILEIPQNSNSLKIFLIYQKGSQFFWYLETEHLTGQMVLLRKIYVHHTCLKLRKIEFFLNGFLVFACVIQTIFF